MFGFLVWASLQGPLVLSLGLLQLADRSPADRSGEGQQKAAAEIPNLGRHTPPLRSAQANKDFSFR